MKPRKKKCRSCGEKFQPWNSMQVACSPKCALDVGKKDVEKKERKAHKEAKERIKSRSDWLREAQQAFNRYIRLRDHAEPCISCQRHHQGQYHAGHYRTVGGNPELRFEELNCMKQCSACNNHLSGNIVNFRLNLIKRIGQDKVDWLEGPHEPKKYTVDEIKAIKSKYIAKCRELNKELKSKGMI